MDKHVHGKRFSVLLSEKSVKSLQLILCFGIRRLSSEFRGFRLRRDSAELRFQSFSPNIQCIIGSVSLTVSLPYSGILGVKNVKRYLPDKRCVDTGRS